ncbi:MAG TPA: aldose epimerase family protein [Longimicrobiales bacterium]
MKRIVVLVAAGLISASLSACQQKTSNQSASVQKMSFGTTADGRAIDSYTLRNAHGIEMRVTNYGGVITSLKTPDRSGRLDDIVLGFDSLAPYLAGTPYFGAIIGRYGNRIANGTFQLDGQTYTLAKNNGPNHLHGGVRGFDKVVWTAEPFERAAERGLIFRYTSPDGEEGYPGTLNATVTYTLNDNDQLVVEYHATTDKATPVNLTQHSYFNLAGAGNGDILKHELMIAASRFTPVDSTLIPTGQIVSVEGTPFDFRSPTAIGARINNADPQLKNGGGYDHNFVLDRKGRDLELAARVTEPTTGRTLEIRTTEPGIQFYSGNFLDGTIKGKAGKVYPYRGGFCLETQHYPDSPNQPSFPSTILHPGEEYRTRTVFTFGVAK